MNVWYPQPPGDEWIAVLRRLVGPEIRIFVDSPALDQCTMLIEGRPINAQLQSLSNLKYVVVPFAGVPEHTLELLRLFPALQLHNLHHNASDTAELAIALMMCAAKRIVPLDQAMRKGDWSLRTDGDTFLSLCERKVLVLGFGEIGQRIAASCLSLGMEVEAISRRGGMSAETNVPCFPISQLRQRLANTDVLILALPLTKSTEGLIGDTELKTMPKGGILVNISRARIVDEKALYEALTDQHLHSAGIDVWYQYPGAEDIAGGRRVRKTPTFPSQFPFHHLSNVVLSPHRGGTTDRTENRRMHALAKLIHQAARGECVDHRVSMDQGY